MNEIGVVTVDTHRPVFVDPYQQNRNTGSFILIDPLSNATVAAGMIRKAAAVGDDAEPKSFSQAAGPATLLDVSGRADVAAVLESRLLEAGFAVVRTRVREFKFWKALLQLGATVIVEQDASASALDTISIRALDLTKAISIQKWLPIPWAVKPG